MDPRDLLQHKLAFKTLAGQPEFKNIKRGKLPRPLHKLGGPRVHCTPVITLSDTHRAVMLWRDGDTLQDTAFYGYLFCCLQNGDLSPLFELHWHPSHKGLHCKTPCRSELNHTGRLLPGAQEFSISGEAFDPRNPNDLSALVLLFCDRCGITIETDASQRQLFEQ